MGDFTNTFGILGQLYPNLPTLLAHKPNNQVLTRAVLFELMIIFRTLP